jgi:ribosomal-protein-alanine N-acetyltransferase
MIDPGAMVDTEGMLETGRLSLLPWNESDLANLSDIRILATDPEIMRYINGGVPWTDDQMLEFVQRQIHHYRDRGYCLWKIQDRGAQTFLGFCGIQPTVVEGSPEVEIGWWLRREYWGQGLISEAAGAALQDAFDRVGLQRLIAIIQPANARSIAVAKRLGMRYESDAVYKDTPVSIFAISPPRPAS